MKLTLTLEVPGRMFAAAFLQSFFRSHNMYTLLEDSKLHEHDALISFSWPGSAIECTAVLETDEDEPDTDEAVAVAAVTSTPPEPGYSFYLNSGEVSQYPAESDIESAISVYRRHVGRDMIQDVEHWERGYALTLQWDKTMGIWIPIQ